MDITRLDVRGSRTVSLPALTLAMALTLGLLACLTPRADAAVYWLDARGIGRANLDGTGVQEGWIPGVKARGLAVNSTHIYWAEEVSHRSGHERSRIGSALLDGSGIRRSVVTGLRVVNAVGANDSYVYWMDRASDSQLERARLGRARANGTGARRSLVKFSHAQSPSSPVADAQHVYWAEKHDIKNNTNTYLVRASLDGSHRRRILDFPTYSSVLALSPADLHLGGGYLYWSELINGVGGFVEFWRAPVTGGYYVSSVLQQRFKQIYAQPAADASYLYWRSSAGWIARGDVSGNVGSTSGVQPRFIHTGRSLSAIAVNSRPAAATPPPPPVKGKSVNVGATSGTVRIRRRGSRGFTTLRDDQQVPVGSEVDARRGRVRLTVENDPGVNEVAEFYNGVFIVRQLTRRVQPLTQLSLSQPLSCPRSAGTRASASKRRRGARRRRLWGTGVGHFRTRGRHAAATVRGTVWMTQDTCTATTVRVKQGVVDVFAFPTKRTIQVSAGHSVVVHGK